MANRFAIQGIVANAVQYQGVEGYQVDRGNTVLSEGSDGTVLETQHFLVRRAPVATLQSFDLFGMLDPSTGLLRSSASVPLPLVALDGVNGIKMYGAQGQDGSPAFFATSVASSRSALNGVLAFKSLRWSPGQRAVIDIGGWFKGTGDGLTECITENNADTLPVWTNKAPAYGFALTALNLNGVAVNLVNSLSIDADAKFEPEYSLGLPQPTNIKGAGVTGKLAWTMRADLGDLLVGEGSGAVAATFSQFTEESAGFTGHTVTFTLAGQWSLEDSWGGQNNQAMNKQLMIRSLYNGTTLPMTLSST